MTHVAVVTDSSCDLSSSSFEGLGVTVVDLGDAGIGTLESDAGDVRSESCGRSAVAAAPSRAEIVSETFVRAYEALADDADAIISLHASSRLALATHAARTARERLRGMLPIEVVDTGLTSIALGFVVRRVARAGLNGHDLAELDFLARRSSANVHAMFFAESIDYLNPNARWRRERAWPISGNGTRPLLHVEDGEVRPLERVRTRARGYDRLAEFVELFSHVDEIAVFHDAPAGELELLMRRIDPLHPRDRIEIGGYGPTLRAELGPRAIGVFVDEGIGYD